MSTVEQCDKSILLWNILWTIQSKIMGAFMKFNTVINLIFFVRWMYFVFLLIKFIALLTYWEIMGNYDWTYFFLNSWIYHYYNIVHFFPNTLKRWYFRALLFSQAISCIVIFTKNGIYIFSIYFVTVQWICVLPLIDSKLSVIYYWYCDI